MDFFNSTVRFLIAGYGGLLAGLDPIFSLALLSVLTGVGMLWVFRRTSNQQAILRTKKRLQAHLLELRLFGDDLPLVLQAQKNLLVGNLRYLGLMLLPALFLMVPLVILLIHLDALYGRRALPVGEPSVVTVQVARGFTADSQGPRLEAPPEIAIETPAVPVQDKAQFSWRIRPRDEVDARLRFVWGDAEWDKTIAAGETPRYLSNYRVRPWVDSFLNPGEERLPLDGIEWVEVRYPPATMEVAGLELHWLIWFFLISMVTALALKKYFKVVF